MDKNKLIEMMKDCEIMLKKLGDIPFDKAYEFLQKDLWEIGDRYGLTGPEVFTKMMENFDMIRRN